MNKLVLSVLLFMTCMGMQAQKGDASLHNKFAIQRMKFERTNAPLMQRMGKSPMLKKAAMPSSANMTMAIAKLSDGVTDEDLRAQGVTVTRRLGDFAFIVTTLDDAERVASLDLFKTFEFERPLKQSMIYSRQVTNVDKVHEGVGLTQAYTGKGVVCGIVDNGFDLNHANFLDDKGEPRVKYFEKITTNSNATSLDDYFILKSYATPEEIKALTTDNTRSYHGTHTMGIMAGGYRGNTKAALVENVDGVYTTTLAESMPNPYYGMAYNSDIIAATSGNMSNIEIAQAVIDLAYYQKYSNQPVVINLSLGSISGPHDGSNSECQVFDFLEDTLGTKIVIASGNEGNMKLALTKTMTANDSVMRTFMTGAEAEADDTTRYMRYGTVEIYSNDSKPFKSLSVVLFNTSRGRVAKIFKLTPTEDNIGSGVYYYTTGYSSYVGSNAVEDATLGKYFEGYICMGWSVDESNGKAYAMIDVALLDNAVANADNQYVIGFQVEGEEGQRFEAYANGTCLYGFDNLGVDGWDDGSGNGTISSMATGKKTLSVGSYTEMNAWSQLDGYSYTQLNADNTPVLKAGKVSDFTSYGTLADGRKMPYVLGPGAYVISSMNRYYFEAAGYTDYEDLLSAVALNTTSDPYGWSAGTSMACPAVAGIIALWLEADPTLTMDEIKEIIAATAYKTNDMIIGDSVQVGHGLIDAYEGLKEVLRRKDGNGINDVTANESRLVAKSCGDRKVSVFVAGERSLNVDVYDMAGHHIMRDSANGDEAVIDLTAHPKGAYIIRVNGRMSKCIIVK